MEILLSEILRDKGDRVCLADPESTLSQAAQKMKNERVGALFVMNGDRIIGVLTERDILNKVVAETRHPDNTKVHEVMSKDIVVVKPSRTVHDAMKVVTEKRVRHLPVVSEGKLVGIISNGDLTRRIIANDQGHISTLYDYIYGTYPG